MERLVYGQDAAGVYIIERSEQMIHGFKRQRSWFISLFLQ